MFVKYGREYADICAHLGLSDEAASARRETARMEDAGIFCHNNPWISCAETMLGHGNRAFSVFRKTCPVYLEDKADVRRVEPYVYCQMIAGPDSASFGEGKNSWLTGTAAWTFTCISQYILGIRPTLDGLMIDPCIPSSLREYRCARSYRGARYHITIDNHAGVEHGIASITVNGVSVSSNIISPLGDTAEYEVKIVMG